MANALIYVNSQDELVQLQVPCGTMIRDVMQHSAEIFRIVHECPAACVSVKFIIHILALKNKLPLRFKIM